MFIALYEMVAKENREAEFETAWANVTEAIFRVRGSLGSRLHKAEASRTYVAYAQWPSREIFEDTAGTSKFTEDEKAAFAKMKDSAEQIKTIHLLDVCDDRLRPASR